MREAAGPRWSAVNLSGAFLKYGGANGRTAAVGDNRSGRFEIGGLPSMMP
jgi:hypothetical protein